MDRLLGHRLLWSDHQWPEAEGLRRAWRGPLLEPWRVVRDVQDLSESLLASPPELCLWHQRALADSKECKGLLERLAGLSVPSVVGVDERSTVQSSRALIAAGCELVVGSSAPVEVWLKSAQRALANGRRRARRAADRSSKKHRDDPARLIGQGDWMRDLRRAISQCAEAPGGLVWIRGEPGTGKCRVARAVQALRPGGVFHRLCAADLRDVAAERLLGSSARPGLLEMGEGGVLYIEAPQLLSRAAFQRLLRFGASGRVDSVDGCRTTEAETLVMVAVHGAAAEERFALSASDDGVIDLPSLRARGTDLGALAEFFCRRASSRVGDSCGITPAALALLSTHAWPGNLYELHVVLEQAVRTARGMVDVGDLPFEVRRGLQSHDGRSVYALPAQGIDVSCVIAGLLDQALQMSSGNKTLAAQLLGIHRDQVRYWVKKYGLSQWVRSRGGSSPRRESVRERGA